jgi:23S rRNA (cytidine1920-2'-O)/16S rRNA (cytidine1409-2'-O)-methyltransferase
MARRGTGDRKSAGQADLVPAARCDMPPNGERDRLDRILVERGLIATRARARDLVVRGLVTVAGRVETRPGRLVHEAEAIGLTQEGPLHVSRGGAKLAAALDAFTLSPEGLACLDIGASTGGFTQVLLERGARRVLAVDVGHGQLHPSLAGDARVLSRERTDARTLSVEGVGAALGGPVEAIVVDVSFISVLRVLEPVVALATPGTWLVVLVKPQFEVGREGVGKGGIVRDPEARRAAAERVGEWLAECAGWQLLGAVPSPITGGHGNEETLIGARFHG